MKKNVILTTLVGFLLVGCANSTVQTNPNPSVDTDSYSLIKKNEYNKGYNDALEKNKDKWVQMGFNEAKKSLNLYKKDIKSYEAGKYALKEKLITNPRIYAVRGAGGTIEVKTLGCQIAPLRNPNQILDFYKKYKNYIEVINDDSNAFSTSSKKVSNQNLESVGIISYYENSKSDTVKPQEIQRVIKTFPKSYKMKNMVEQYGLNCTLDKTDYLCQFSSKNVLDEFCKQSGMCK